MLIYTSPVNVFTVTSSHPQNCKFSASWQQFWLITYAVTGSQAHLNAEAALKKLVFQHSFDVKSYPEFSLDAFKVSPSRWGTIKLRYHRTIDKKIMYFEQISRVLVSHVSEGE